ncbi:MAG: hypothetical protein GXP62_15000, partial [Oligoflexia bacterium]|nr:hypothetical protein [Oligoflexia bacterium]
MIDAIISAFSGPGAGFMYAITAVLAFSLAITIERSWLYWLTWRVDSDAILNALRTDDLAGAQTAAAAHPGARLLAAGVAAAEVGAGAADAAWDAMGAEAALV